MYTGQISIKEASAFFNFEITDILHPLFFWCCYYTTSFWFECNLNYLNLYTAFYTKPFFKRFWTASLVLLRVNPLKLMSDDSIYLFIKNMQFLAFFKNVTCFLYRDLGSIVITSLIVGKSEFPISSSSMCPKQKLYIIESCTTKSGVLLV